MSGVATPTRPAYKGEGQQLYTLDGVPYWGQPDRVNAMGYPSAGGRRLYTAEHLHRRGRPILQAPPSGADPVVALVRAELMDLVRHARGKEAAFAEILKLVSTELLERSERGVAKYGTTLARTDLSRYDWLRHLFEELLDGMLYTRRLMLDAREGEDTAWHQRLFDRLLDAALDTRRLMLDEEWRKVTAAPPLTPLEIELIEGARAETGNGS